jgi:hypothetical protein
MSDPASIPSKSKHSIPSQRRLHACDAIRGLLLAIGFADHIDAATYSTLGLRDWTLAGLGLSDASDGSFAYLDLFLGMRIRVDSRMLESARLAGMDAYA